MHDFRRTCASRLADLDTNSDVIEKVLNHVVPGVKGIYNRSDYLQDRLVAQTKLSEKLGIASALVKLTVTDAEVAEEVETQVKSTAEPATITSPAPVSTTNKMAACKSPPPSATNADSTSPIPQSTRPSTLAAIPYNFASTKDVTYGNSVVFNSLRLSGESLTEATVFISPPPPE
ncbi:hypothetical protein [Shewanella khirikhana]|uniref:hypothetical protein n=1 Tax=Shewanella khirikhana TaxID=1965282 RepID=UPI003BB0F08E